MEGFKNLALKELTDQQVRFTPPARRMEQLARAERLLGGLDVNKQYPYQYVCYRITGYRPDGWSVLENHFWSIGALDETTKNGMPTPTNRTPCRVMRSAGASATTPMTSRKERATDDGRRRFRRGQARVDERSLG